MPTSTPDSLPTPAPPSRAAPWLAAVATFYPACIGWYVVLATLGYLMWVVVVPLHFLGASGAGPVAAVWQGLRLVASPDGAQDSVTIHADARLYAGLFDADQAATLALDPARKAYVHLIRGQLEVNGVALSGGDAVLLQDESQVRLERGVDAEVLVFDLQA